MGKPPAKQPSQPLPQEQEEGVGVESEVVEGVEEMEGVEGVEGGGVGGLAGPVVPSNLSRQRLMRQAVAISRRAGQEIRHNVTDFNNINYCNRTVLGKKLISLS